MDNNNYNEPDEGSSQIQNNSNYKNNLDTSGVSNNSLAMASFILGIMAVASICCIAGSYILGSIAIVLAVLSRGAEKKYSSQSLAGIILSAAGMIISSILIIVYIIQFFSLYNNTDEFLRDYQYFYESIYGDDTPFNSELFNDDNSMPEKYYPFEPDNTL